MNVLLLPVQIILSLFLVFAISRAYLRFKEGTINAGNFIFWISLWCLALFSIFEPSFTTYWAQLLGVGRGADAIIYASIIILFYLIFRTNVLIENLREDISKLVRIIALKDNSNSSKRRSAKNNKKR